MLLQRSLVCLQTYRLRPFFESADVFCLDLLPQILRSEMEQRSSSLQLVDEELCRSGFLSK